MSFNEFGSLRVKKGRDNPMYSCCSRCSFSCFPHFQPPLVQYRIYPCEISMTRIWIGCAGLQQIAVFPLTVLIQVVLLKGKLYSSLSPLWKEHFWLQIISKTERLIVLLSIFIGYKQCAWVQLAYTAYKSKQKNHFIRTMRFILRTKNWYFIPRLNMNCLVPSSSIN